VLLLRVGFLMLMHSLHSVDSAKVKAATLNLADATLLVLDGLEDEGMELARSLLAKSDTNANFQVELDDGSKGTPLAVAIHSMASPKAENCMGLIHALLSRKDVDVNTALTFSDDSTAPPLLLAMNAIAAGVPVGMDITNALLAHDQISVNSMSAGGSTKLAPLHMALAAAARGVEAGLEVARALLARSDTDADVEMVGPDGTKMTPLMKLASMLQAQPSDANLLKAIALLHGRAKPLQDETLQTLIDEAMKPKEGKDEV